MVDKKSKKASRRALRSDSSEDDEDHEQQPLQQSQRRKKSESDDSDASDVSFDVDEDDCDFIADEPKKAAPSKTKQEEVKGDPDADPDQEPDADADVDVDAKDNIDARETRDTKDTRDAVPAGDSSSPLEATASIVENALSNITPPPKSKKRKKPGNLNNYGMFTKYMKDTGAVDGSMKVPESSKIISELWKKTPAKEKERYRVLAKEYNRRQAIERGEDPDNPPPAKKRKKKKKPSKDEDSDTDTKKSSKKKKHPKKKKTKEEDEPQPAQRSMPSMYPTCAQPQPQIQLQPPPPLQPPKSAYMLYKETVKAEMQDNRRNMHLTEQELGNLIHANWEQLQREARPERQYYEMLAETARREQLQQHFSSVGNGMTFVGPSSIPVRF
jgi:hypothetical protein